MPAQPARTAVAATPARPAPRPGLDLPPTPTLPRNLLPAPSPVAAANRPAVNRARAIALASPPPWRTQQPPQHLPLATWALLAAAEPGRWELASPRAAIRLNRRALDRRRQEGPSDPLRLLGARRSPPPGQLVAQVAVPWAYCLVPMPIGWCLPQGRRAGVWQFGRVPRLERWYRTYRSSPGEKTTQPGEPPRPCSHTSGR